MSSYPGPSLNLQTMGCGLVASPGLSDVSEHLKREKEKYNRDNKEKKTVKIETDRDRLPTTKHKEN